MFKKIKSFLLLAIVGSICFLNAEEAAKDTVVFENEVEVLEQLIGTTAQKLEKYKELKRIMQEYKSQKEAFALGNHSKQHAARMVKTARKIQETINDQHIAHLFSSEYLEELAMFSSIAGKYGPKRP